MFYITITGRKGFYDGVKVSGDTYENTTSNSFTNIKGSEEYDSDFSEGVIVTHKTRRITRSLKMKNDVSYVNLKRAYNTREEAQAELDIIIALYGEDRTQHGYTNEYPEYDDGGWARRKPTGRILGSKSIQIYDDSKIEKYDGKFVIFEDVDGLVPKKSHSINLAMEPSYEVDDQEYRVGVCDACRITLTKDEPVVRLGRYKICNNCIQRMAGELGGRYDKLPMAEEMTTSWTLEMMSSR